MCLDMGLDKFVYYELTSTIYDLLILSIMVHMEAVVSVMRLEPNAIR